MWTCKVTGLACSNCTECCEFRTSGEANSRYAAEHDRREQMSREEVMAFTDEPKPSVPAIGSVLSEAVEVVNGKRLNVYGQPENSFALIGMFWDVVDMADPEMPDTAKTALKMALMKVARILQNPLDRDSWRDAAGYIGIGCDMAFAGDIEKDSHDAQ